jgi:hypothetical protein
MVGIRLVMKTAGDKNVIELATTPQPYEALKRAAKAYADQDPVCGGDKDGHIASAYWNAAYPTKILALLAERDADKAAIEEMRAALKPFAIYISAVDPDGVLEGEIGGVVTGTSRRSISYSACRNAAHVLASPTSANSIRAAVFEEIAVIADALAKSAGVKSDLSTALRSEIEND